MTLAGVLAKECWARKARVERKESARAAKDSVLTRSFLHHPNDRPVFRLSGEPRKAIQRRIRSSGFVVRTLVRRVFMWRCLVWVRNDGLDCGLGGVGLLSHSPILTAVWV